MLDYEDDEPDEGCPDCGTDAVTDDVQRVYCTACGWRP
jgi:ribosomal protein L37E